MELRKFIREMVETELDEMARISTNIKIGDPEKATIAKQLYAGTWYGDMIDYVEEAGATGIPQPELARMLGKSGQQAINPKVRDFLESNIFTKGELSIPKKEKSGSIGTGIQGRPTSEKTLMAKDVNTKIEADANYKPSEDELAALGAEFIEKLRARVNGTLRRGRPVMPSKSKDGMIAAMKNIANAEDTDGDGDVDDDDLDDIAESIIKHKKQPMKKQPMKKQPMNEQFLKMQKLAGLITESEYREKRDENQALGTLFFPEEDEDGMIEFYWNDDKVIDTIKNMGYNDPEEIARELTTVSSPDDFLQMMRSKTGDEDLGITDITLDMFKQSVEDEFEK
jgi:hypothetical protein